MEFSRNRDDHVIYKALLKKMGVLIYSVTKQTDPDTPHGFLMEGILEVISEFYNLNLRNEVFKGMKENTKRGFHNGGTAAYGYQISKVIEPSGATKSILVPGPDIEVSTVKRIFDLYVNQGYGYKKITDILNADKIPSPSSELWSYSSIHSILHNEVYIGNTVWNMYDYRQGKKKKPEEEWIRQANTHMALIETEIDSETTDIIICRLKYFINNIRTESQDHQNLLLKEWISSVTFNLVNSIVNINLQIKSTKDPSITIFEKNIYVAY